MGTRSTLANVSPTIFPGLDSIDHQIASLDDANTFAALVTCTIGMQATPIARTATADGTTTGTIGAGSSYVSITSAGANNIIILPAPVVGNIIWMHVGANGCELRSSAPATIAINGGTGSAVESALPANSLSCLVCVELTKWVGFEVASNGAVSAVEVAA